MRLALLLVSSLLAANTPAQTFSAMAFEVATIHAVDSQPKSGRFIRMESPHRFVARNMPLQLLIAAAYNVNPKAITGGPGWVDSAKFDIDAVTPGQTQPRETNRWRCLRRCSPSAFSLPFIGSRR